ncbi:MAG: glycerophosphodiester phosphodiesterase [Chloroflexaceae bacterium]|nr:glycerophosphodiester phosphodiesterase [Chloroflexaceae bacterium]
MTAQRIIDAMHAGSPLVFGHRGAKAYAPMNTLPAFELAAAQGAHGVELDVHRSQDGHGVLMHDFMVDATTNGSGRITDMTLAELKALDAGRWFGPAFAGTPVPTLDEVFEAVGQRLFINVEIKAEGPTTDGVEEVVAACIKRHNMQERVLVSSFNPPTLVRFRALLPAVMIGYLFHGPVIALPHDATYEAYHPHHEMVNANLIELCRRHQKFINVWTVNDPAQAVELVRMGVHGIVTDNPDTVLAALR